MSQKHQIVYAFIDSQNLNLGTGKDLYRGKKKVYTGWKLDFTKFRRYLSDKFRVTKAFLFIGYIKSNEPMYRQLKSFGYDIVFKPTTKDSEGKPKGNIDAELVLHAAAVQFTKYDQAVVVSGDGDFHCLHEYLQQKNKLKAIIIPNAKSESSLLKTYHQYKVFIEFERSKLEYKNERRRV